MISPRHAAYARARRQAIEEHARLLDRPQPLLYAWGSREWNEYRDDRSRRLASLERQIIALTDIITSFGED